MGTIASKLSYLNGTKRLFREILNKLGASLPVDIDFRSYIGLFIALRDSAIARIDPSLDPEEIEEFPDGIADVIEDFFFGSPS